MHPSPKAETEKTETDMAERLPPMIRNSRAALIVAHPGHELRMHHWLELAHPTVYVLTDGSGHTGSSRLETTTKLLVQTGAKPGSIYGRFTDLEMYKAILKQDSDIFIRLTEELAESLEREQIAYVVGDATEGYNPTHDLCRAVINAAVELAGPGERRIANFEFPVVGPPEADGEADCLTIRLRLDREALDRKLSSAAAYRELSGDVAAQVDERGSSAFQIESLRQVTHGQRVAATKGKPFYEQYGEKQVALGHYLHVIRQREHLSPLIDAIWNHVLS